MFSIKDLEDEKKISEDEIPTQLDSPRSANKNSEQEGEVEVESEPPKEPKKYHNPRLPTSLPKSTKPQFSEKDFEGEIRRFISQANVIFSRAPPTDRAAAASDPNFWAEFESRQDKIFTAKSDKNMMAVRSAIGEACQFLRERFAG